MKFFAHTAASDSDTVEKIGECKECGATVRVDQGLCASCLLSEGLEAAGEASAEVFESVLVEANVPEPGGFAE